MAYGDFKELTRRTSYDKILHDKAFNIAKKLHFLIKKNLLEQSKMKLCLINN